MRKNLVMLAILGILGLGGVGLSPRATAQIQQKKNFYEKKEKIGTRSFRYSLDNGVVIDVTYSSNGSFELYPFGDLDDQKVSYDKEKNETTSFRLSGRTFKIVDEADDGSVEKVIYEHGSSNDVSSRKKNPVLYQKAENYLEKIKEMVRWKHLRKESEQFKVPKTYVGNWGSFKDFYREFCKWTETTR